MSPLTSAQLRRVAQTQRVVLGALDHTTARAWIATVATEFRGLFASERARISLGLASGHAVPDEVASQAYVDPSHTLDDLSAMVVWLSDPFAPGEEPHRVAPARPLVGPIYHEWFLPDGLDESAAWRADGVGLGDSQRYGRYPDALLVALLLGGSRVSRGPAGRPMGAMLTLLLPAFAASARALQTAALTRQTAPAVVDGLGVAAWLYDETGRCVHEAPEATRRRERLAEGDRLRDAARHLAAALLAAPRHGAPVVVSHTLTVDGQALTVTGALVETGPAPVVVVRVEDVAPPVPDDAVLRERFGLSVRQAAVARLLAERRSTAEIAAILFISPHTVRRHVEHVLAKLGAASRADAERIMRHAQLGGSAPPPA